MMMYVSPFLSLTIVLSSPTVSISDTLVDLSLSLFISATQTSQLANYFRLTGSRCHNPFKKSFPMPFGLVYARDW